VIVFVVSSSRNRRAEDKMKNLKRKPQDQAEAQELEPLLTAEQRERQRQAAALVRAWAQEEDDGLWPLVEKEFGLSRG
jgi:hypothetical protein